MTLIEFVRRVNTTKSLRPSLVTPSAKYLASIPECFSSSTTISGWIKYRASEDGGISAEKQVLRSECWAKAKSIGSGHRQVCLPFEHASLRWAHNCTIITTSPKAHNGASTRGSRGFYLRGRPEALNKHLTLRWVYQDLPGRDRQTLRVKSALLPRA